MIYIFVYERQDCICNPGANLDNVILSNNHSSWPKYSTRTSRTTLGNVWARGMEVVDPTGDPKIGEFEIVETNLPTVGAKYELKHTENRYDTNIISK